MEDDIPQDNLHFRTQSISSLIPQKFKPTAKEPTAPYVRFVILKATRGGKYAMGVCGLGKAMLALKDMVVGWLTESAGIEISTVYYYMRA